MSDLGEDGDEWRQYEHQYEHQQQESPLTAVTTAMLSMHGGEEQSSAMPLLYDYYRNDGSASGSSNVGGALDSKTTNGLPEGVVGVGPVEGLLFVGGAEDVKREPEDLTAGRRPTSPAERGVLCDKRRALLATHGDSPPDLDGTSGLKEELDHRVIKEEVGERPRANQTLVIQAPLDSGEKMSAGAGSYITGFPATSPQTSYEHMPTYLASSPQPYATSSSPAVRGSPSVYTVATEYYPRDYYTTTDTQYGTVRQEYSASDVAFVDRYLRPANAYKTTTVSGLTVDLPSPDSGISADAITPRDQATITQNFEYGEVVQQGSILGTDHRVAVPGTSPNLQRSTRPWHEFRHTDSDKMQIPKIHSDDDKIHIPKIHSAYGFKYHLESPISTSQRREDDRITYINKGQFYGITMEYIPDPDKPLKATTVKSVVMLMFREEKTPEDEIKAWQFWHGRQHSVKQRILDVDTKNSVGVVPGIEEVAHNAIAVYWMPLEQSAKINIAVQCLSTDFSSQKGVKGLPLHIQIDTYEDARDNSQVFHRGYCQIKVFCDKGAERKTRDEERRATKRRMNATGRKKYEDLYHASCDRSEFYSMSDLSKPPVLFTPAEDVEKGSYFQITSMELGFYGHDPENGVCSVGVTGGVSTVEGPSPTTLSPQHGLPTTPGRGVSPTLDPIPTNTPLIPAQVPPPVASPTSKPITTSSTYKFHYSFPQPYGDARKDLATTQLANGSLDSPMAEVFTHVHKRSRLTPPLSERVMLYVRQDNEELYTPLHLVPPSTIGLMKAIELKYKIPMSSIKNIYRKNRIGIMAKVDDDMLRMYCNEDTFLMEIQPRDADAYDLTLIELGSGPEH